MEYSGLTQEEFLAGDETWSQIKSQASAQTLRSQLQDWASSDQVVLNYYNDQGKPPLRRLSDAPSIKKLTSIDPVRVWISNREDFAASPVYLLALDFSHSDGLWQLMNAYKNCAIDHSKKVDLLLKQGGRSADLAVGPQLSPSDKPYELFIVLSSEPYPTELVALIDQVRSNNGMLSSQQEVRLLQALESIRGHSSIGMDIYRVG